MAPLIVNGTARFAVNQTYGGRAVVNILDVFIDTTGTVIDRDDAVFDVAGDILNNWDDHIRPLQSNDLTCQSVSWVDMDSATGSTGSRTSTSANTWPAVGGTSTDGSTPNVAALVTKVSSGGGRRTRNGRLYLAGSSELASETNNPALLTDAAQAAITTAFGNFASGINGSIDGTAATAQLVLVRTHKEGDVIVVDGTNDVDSWACQERLATQRRRLRG